MCDGYLYCCLPHPLEQDRNTKLSWQPACLCSPQWVTFKHIANPAFYMTASVKFHAPGISRPLSSLNPQHCLIWLVNYFVSYRQNCYVNVLLSICLSYTNLPAPWRQRLCCNSYPINLTSEIAIILLYYGFFGGVVLLCIPQLGLTVPPYQTWVLVQPVCAVPGEGRRGCQES